MTSFKTLTVKVKFTDGNLKIIHGVQKVNAKNDPAPNFEIADFSNAYTIIPFDKVMYIEVE